MADPVSFDLDGIEWNGSDSNDWRDRNVASRGLKGFSSTSLDAIDMDALAVTLGRQKQLHAISLAGTTSRFSGETIRNLGQLPKSDGSSAQSLGNTLGNGTRPGALGRMSGFETPAARARNNLMTPVCVRFQDATI